MNNLYQYPNGDYSFTAASQWRDTEYSCGVVKVTCKYVGVKFCWHLYQKENYQNENQHTQNLCFLTTEEAETFS